ncbi:hypothetical protein IHE44_0000830 [Lamprotornis superbus]|uniref:Uncharacterized protein n=1 Tax=Lamprotornis superbus TaxID=245042 RepID=A0A835NQI9_9PASS|nr:hypothetical protein IHE44_0000830 [Lamprotornis superbus]
MRRNDSDKFYLSNECCDLQCIIYIDIKVVKGWCKQQAQQKLEEKKTGHDELNAALKEKRLSDQFLMLTIILYIKPQHDGQLMIQSLFFYTDKSCVNSGRLQQTSGGCRMPEFPANSGTGLLFKDKLFRALVRSVVHNLVIDAIYLQSTQK